MQIGIYTRFCLLGIMISLHHPCHLTQFNFTFRYYFICFFFGWLSRFQISKRDSTEHMIQAHIYVFRNERQISQNVELPSFTLMVFAFSRCDFVGILGYSVYIFPIFRYQMLSLSSHRLFLRLRRRRRDCEEEERNNIKLNFQALLSG